MTFLAEEGFYLPNEFKPYKDNLLTTLPMLSKQYRIDCEFWIDSNPSPAAVIHLTNEDRNTHYKGGFISLVYLHSIAYWETYSWVNGRDYRKVHGALSLKKWYKLEVSQTLRDGKVRKFRMSHIALQKFPLFSTIIK